jgi:hypothetical protein
VTWPRCKHCHKYLPEWKAEYAIYCSRSCNKKANKKPKRKAPIAKETA